MIRKHSVRAQRLHIAVAIIGLFVISCAEAKADDASNVPSCFAAPLGYFGIAAPAFDHGGGGVQFGFPSEPVFTERTQPF